MTVIKILMLIAVLGHLLCGICDCCRHFFNPRYSTPCNMRSDGMVLHSADCVGFILASHRRCGKLGRRGHVPGVFIPDLKEITL